MFVILMIFLFFRSIDQKQSITFKYRQFAMVIVERMENDEDVRKSGILIDVCDVVIPIIWFGFYCIICAA